MFVSSDTLILQAFKQTLAIMHFQKQTHYFIPFCLILLMFFAFKNFVLTNATRLPSLNWSKNAEKTAFLSAYNNTSSIEMKSFKRENTILQQMVEKEESLIEDTVDFINGKLIVLKIHLIYLFA